MNAKDTIGCPRKSEPGDTIGCPRKSEPGDTIELATFVESVFEGLSSGAVESEFEPGVTPVERAPEPGFVVSEFEDMPDGHESKFEPGVTVEPKVAVIPGAATQGNVHPADRPGDTAKRKIARERQGRGGRPDPGARKGDATVGRSTRRTARRGGYQAPSCLARGRSWASPTTSRSSAAEATCRRTYTSTRGST